MTTKPTDSAERLKALMRQHTAKMSAPPPFPTIQATLPSSTAETNTVAKTTRMTVDPEKQDPIWSRITVRLTAGEAAKINDVVIATQQANRWAKVTATDVVRIALSRVKESEALDANALRRLRGGSKRSPRSLTV